jgi:hypothetical protein
MTIRTHPKNSLGHTQHALFHEDINSALQGLVAALGGAKAVGSKLYPDLPTDGAARRLLDAINVDRAQQLSQTQFVTLLKWGREGGHHGVMEYLADEAGYTRPSPRDPEDQKAELMRQFIEAVKVSEQIARRLQK